MVLSDILTIAGASVIVTLLTQLIKADVPEKRVPHVALALGVLIVVQASLALGKSTYADLGTAVVTGLLAGAAAIGWYNVEKHSTGLLHARSDIR